MSFGFPTVLQTKPIGYNPRNLDGSAASFRTARITIPTTALSSTSDFAWYLSADGGATWEQATINTTYTFTSTGTSLLLQVLGNPGATITLGTNRLEVVYTYS
jgi:hypothetical protein